MRSWHRASILGRHSIDDGLIVLRLEVAEPVVAAFVRPGQFQVLRHGGDEAMFAIASSPGAARFEYLIRDVGGVTQSLSQAEEGTTLDVTLPEGPGFPLDEARGHDVLLIGTGTALAPLRSVLGAIAAHRSDFGKVTLLQGQRSERQLPFYNELVALADVDVKTVLSSPSAEWKGARGRVQSLVRSAVTKHAVVFLVGQPEMTNEVTALVTEAGVAPNRVFLNV